jgi:hypothetical protein
MSRLHGCKALSALALTAVLTFVVPWAPRASAQGSDACPLDATIASL